MSFLEYDDTSSTFKTLLQGKRVWHGNELIDEVEAYSTQRVLGVYENNLYSTRDVINDDFSFDTQIEVLDLDTLTVTNIDSFILRNDTLESGLLVDGYLACVYNYGGYVMHNLYKLDKNKFVFITRR